MAVGSLLSAINDAMPEISVTTIERARSNVADLRRGLGDLAKWLDSPSTIAHVRERLAQLGEFLERLNAELEQQEKERAQLEGLFAVSRTVNSTLDLDEVLNRAMDVVIQVTGAERGFLMLFDATDQLVFQVARNLERSTITSPVFEVSRSIVERVARSGQPVITTDALSDPRFSYQESVVTLSLRSILCIPLQAKQRVIGAVYVDNRLHAGTFKQEDLNTVRAFANQAAIAIENAQLFESVQQKVNEITALKTFQDNIFASIASGVLVTDLEDRITAFNRAAEMIFAIPATQSLGHPYHETLRALLNTNLPQIVEQVKLRGVRLLATEIASELPERGAVNLSFSVSALKDAGGNPQGVTIVVDDLTEQRRLEATRDMFRRYVAPAVVDRLPNNPDQLKLGGKRQTLTILFADIRGFTRFSEPLAPEQLVDVLNEYLSVAADAILREEGTLDKFMGDAVMAVFNAPLPQQDHALRAARAALAMQRAVTALHTRLPAALRLQYGIGIHTGDAVVGNVGTQQQMNFTAIGDAVNVAKRLQENAHGGQILLSKQTYTQIGDRARARKLAALRVKGRAAVVEAWRLEELLGY
ncbi:MAG: GAF domain-containing protein [Chloroflexi bacterium]|nr:GAF domain-containing protein [Chloroflexota bacterium]